MDFGHFKSQIGRLIKKFGAKYYDEEFCKILWGNVQDLSEDWISKVIAEFIFTARQAPLGEEWRKFVSEEKERLYYIEKKDHKKEAEKFMSKYSGEDIQTICGQITQRVKGQMSDVNFKTFKKMITPPERIRCNRCEDTRAYFDQQIGGWILCEHR